MRYSIITPVYNREDCIARCIESVIRQTANNADFEHVIVDDGSKDGTASIVEKYAEKHDYIKFIRFPQNRGTNAARNAAIKAAKGDFCIILDSDDYFVDDAISIIDETINRKPNYRHYMFAADDTQRFYEAMPLLKGKKEAELTFEQFLGGTIDCDYIHVADRKVLLKYPFNEYLRVHEGLFFLQFYKEVRKMLFTNKVVTIRERSRTDGASREGFKKNKTAIRRSAEYYRLKLEWFEEELNIYAKEKLQQVYTSYMDDLLRLSEYDKLRNLINHVKKNGYEVKAYLSFFYTLRLGQLYYLARKWYLVIKYDILGIRLKI